LVALDEQAARCRQHQERLLRGFGVVEAARLARLQHVEPDAELAEHHLPQFVLERAIRAAPPRPPFGLSDTTNQPSLTGARPEPQSSSRASGMTRLYRGDPTSPALLARLGG